MIIEGPFTKVGKSCNVLTLSSSFPSSLSNRSPITGKKLFVFRGVLPCQEKAGTIPPICVFHHQTDKQLQRLISSNLTVIAICFLQINHPFDKKYSWHFSTNTQAKLTWYLQLQKTVSWTQAVPTNGAPIKNMFSSTYHGYRWLSNKQLAEHSDKLIGKTLHPVQKMPK